MKVGATKRQVGLSLLMLTFVAVIIAPVYGASVDGEEELNDVSADQGQEADDGALDFLQSLSSTSPVQQSQVEDDEDNIWSKMDCSSTLRAFNPMIHKKKYQVAVHAIRGFLSTYKEYNQTFSEYLTATAGHRFDPPIEFEMVPVTFQGLFDAVDEKEVDFFHANPGIFSCIGVERGAQPLATTVARVAVRGLQYDLDVSGGVIFTQGGNDEIDAIEDLKDKVIGVGDISMMMSSQLQFYEMERAGMSYVMDPKQVVFTPNQEDVVRGVLEGDFDVGFVRTDQIERLLDADGNALDADAFKILEPHVYLLDNGELFPFLHSTDIYPESPVAALPHVARDVVEEVQKALFALEHHADAARLSNAFTRCDTTPGLAGLAYNATLSGSLVGFRPARSYFEIRTVQEAAGFINKNEKGDWKCTRADTLYDAISCPDLHIKLTREGFNQSCSAVGLECEGYECFCKPCVRAYDVDVYPYNPLVAEQATNASDYRGCEKMSLCGSAEQTKPATFRITDNKQRSGASVRVVVHWGQKEAIDLEVNEVPDSSWDYEFSWTKKTVGVGLFEIFVGKERISESPIRIKVVPRNCNVDFPGQSMVASKDGVCECGDGTLEFGGKCVDSKSIVWVLSTGGFLFLILVVYIIVEYKNHKTDEMWQVNIDELQFKDPVEVIGQGSFGVVLLAEYRGTKVAIKRAIKSRQKTSASSRKSCSSSKKNTSKNVGPTADALGLASLGTTGSAGMLSAPDETNESPTDIECPATNSRAASVLEGISRKSSEGFDLGFLQEDYGETTNFGGIFPWLKKEKAHRTSLILESGASSLIKTSCLARLCPWFNAQAKREEEFVAEMRILSRLRHPCITTVMGAVINHTHDPMLVMEYMDYGSLHDLLRNETLHLGGDIILQMTRDVAQGLRYLHCSNPPILHGDLKARNILIDSRFRAKLCDFGLSTKQGRSITGTPYWLAPEYLRGEKSYDTTCDMYSTGVILFEIYARKNPYEGEDFKDVLRKVCNKRINKRPAIPDTAPHKAAEMMKKCWSTDLSMRPQAKEMDIAFMEMTAQDLQPLTVEQQAASGSMKRRSSDMIYDLFPRHIANALKKGERVEPETHELVTVLFSDIVHFTDISGSLEPLKVSNMLDRLYLAFDRIAKKHQVFKVETIGDAYMGVTNLEGNQDHNHVKQIAEFAVDMIHEANQILIDEEDPGLGCIHIRVGFHSGPVVSNVIGSLNPRYGLFGDTVNTSSRMESNSASDRIICSEESYKLLKKQAPSIPVKRRGKIKVKGKGDMYVFWVGDKLIQERNPAESPESAVPMHGALAGKRVEFGDVVSEMFIEPSLLPEYPLE